MKIIEDKEFQIFITEEEADIIGKALSRWDGPYSQDQIPKLTKPEILRKNKQLDKAMELALELQNELYARYYKRQEELND